jgi:hypothetical protein
MKIYDIANPFWINDCIYAKIYIAVKTDDVNKALDYCNNLSEADIRKIAKLPDDIKMTFEDDIYECNNWDCDSDTDMKDFAQVKNCLLIDITDR